MCESFSVRHSGTFPVSDSDDREFKRLAQVTWLSRTLSVVLTRDLFTHSQTPTDLNRFCSCLCAARETRCATSRSCEACCSGCECVRTSQAPCPTPALELQPVFLAFSALAIQSLTCVSRYISYSRICGRVSHQRPAEPQ